MGSRIRHIPRRVGGDALPQDDFNAWWPHAQWDGYDLLLEMENHVCRHLSLKGKVSSHTFLVRSVRISHVLLLVFLARTHGSAAFVRCERAPKTVYFGR